MGWRHAGAEVRQAAVPDGSEVFRGTAQRRPQPRRNCRATIEKGSSTTAQPSPYKGTVAVALPKVGEKRASWIEGTVPRRRRDRRPWIAPPLLRKRSYPRAGA